jgi:hypothetical protein
MPFLSYRMGWLRPSDLQVNSSRGQARTAGRTPTTNNHPSLFLSAFPMFIPSLSW